MVAIAIGALLLLGLSTVFFNSSRSTRELDRSGQMLENGRYGLTLLGDDLRHAGFYGEYFNLDTPPSFPDPCETATLANLITGMTQPIQGYNAATATALPNISATSCGGLLPNANLSPGSDILVLRRAETLVFTGAAVEQEIYLQTNGRQYELMIGAGGSAVPSVQADGDANTMLKYPDSDPPLPGAANTRKYAVHMYFVAPCSIGTNTDGVCQVGDDPVPTLKRLELTSDGTNTVMSIVPLVEGIEYFKVLYGVDNTPNTINATTNQFGDGNPDTYVAAPTSAQWPHVIAARIFLLARTVEPVDPRENYVDNKTYTLAGLGISPGGSFKRHVYGTEIRPLNMAGRREIPK
ncbi:MAG: PilW family protein, partial [Gammaproteobacteria bacterium]